MINDKDTITNLLNQYGSPLYIFNKQKFIENYKHFNNAMKNKYDKYHIAYSFKTNYTPYICKLVKELGGYAEVVSDMEYYFAKKIGYEDNHIVYNGPAKGELAIKMLLNGGLLNVDNLDELNRLVEVANNNKDKVLNIGLRLNFDIGQSFVSRFGIDVDSKDIETVIETINKIPNMNIVGLHYHVGRSRTTEAWSNRADCMINTIEKYFKNTKLKYIDLGSGMFADMDERLASQFGNDIPTFEDYAGAVCTKISNYYKNFNDEDKPILFTEPGTTLINSYIDFASTVTSIKNIRGNEFIVLDASKHNIGEICTLKKMPIEIVNNNKNNVLLNNASIVGYTCLEHDVMYEGFKGNLSVGDYIVFGNVGGYSNVSKPPFILPNCAMVSFDNNKVELIKRKETFDDILQTYIV